MLTQKKLLFLFLFTRVRLNSVRTSKPPKPHRGASSWLTGRPHKSLQHSYGHRYHNCSNQLQRHMKQPPHLPEPAPAAPNHYYSFYSYSLFLLFSLVVFFLFELSLSERHVLLEQRQDTSLPKTLKRPPQQNSSASAWWDTRTSCCRTELLQP